MDIDVLVVLVNVDVAIGVNSTAAFVSSLMLMLGYLRCLVLCDFGAFLQVGSPLYCRFW
jgi:hypothetical protein